MDAARALALETGVDEIRFGAPQVNELVGIHAPRDPQYHTELSNLHSAAVMNTPPEDNQEACVWHYMMSAINWDGSVSPCCVLYKMKDDFGSIGEYGQHPFMQAYNSRSYQSVRAGNSRGMESDSPLVCFQCLAAELRSSKGLNDNIVHYCKLRALSVFIRLHSLLGSWSGRFSKAHV
jgi:hypothetical protein